MLGRSPGALHRFLAAYVKYTTQFYAYVRIAADPYPSFDGPDGYPIDLSIAPPAPQSRWTDPVPVPARDPGARARLGDGRWPRHLQLPRRLQSRRLSQTGLAGTVAVRGLVRLRRARRNMPRGMRDVVAWSLGYGAQLWAYLLLLTTAIRTATR